MSMIKQLKDALNEDYVTEFIDFTKRAAVGDAPFTIKDTFLPEAFKALQRIIIPDNALEMLNALEERQQIEFERFVKRILREKAHNGQIEVLDDDSELQFILADRQSGKTEAMAMLIVQSCATPNTPALFVSGTFKTAVDTIWERVISYAKQTDLHILKASIPKITFFNGSTLSIWGSNDARTIENMRGQTIKLILVDELQRVDNPSNLINAVLKPMMNKYVDGKLIVTGTPPRSRGSWFQKEWTNAPYWSKHEFHVEDNPAIRDAVALRIKRQETMTQDEYRREMLHEFAYDISVVLFPSMVTYAPETFEDILQQVKPYKIIIGVDVGFSDYSAVVTCLNNGDKTICYDAVQGHWTTEQLADQIKEQLLRATGICKRFEIHKADRTDTFGRVLEKGDHVTVKTQVVVDSANRLTIEDLNNTYNIRCNGAMKTDKKEAVLSLSTRLRGGEFLIPEGTLLFEELEAACWKENKVTGEVSDQIVSTTDSHADIPHALLYASREIR